LQSSSRAARAALVTSGLGALLFAAGPASVQLGASSPFVGFRIFGVGLLLAALGALLGLVGLWTTRTARGLSGRGGAWAAVALGAAVVAVTGWSAGGATGLPVINDVTTDPDDPPAFRAAQQLEPNRGRDLAYAGAELARQQRSGYPDLAPFTLTLPPGRCLEQARRSAEALGWEVIAEDAAEGRLEATDTTRLFRFVDDVVVRVRPSDAGCVVDVRSKSRDGRGDMGANAARIRAFGEALRG
jgi:uncharacterized protein (DUF1499 family)